MLNRLIKLLVIALLTISFACSSFASPTIAGLFISKKIYKIVNEDGSITFSDTPVSGAEVLVISVPTSNISSNMSPKTIQIPPNQTEQVNYKLNVITPENDATIRNNLGTFTIATSIEPVATGLFQLNINGQIIESPSGTFQLQKMNRGAYQYTVKFIDTSGKIIASTQTRNLYLHQASVLNN